MSHNVKSASRMNFKAVSAMAVLVLVVFCVYLAWKSTEVDGGARIALEPKSREGPAPELGEASEFALASGEATREAVQKTTETASVLEAKSSEADPNSSEPVTTEGWELLLEKIRVASSAKRPHKTAWPHVQGLAAMLRSEAKGRDQSFLAPELEALLKDPLQESGFVRGALLMSLGLAYSEDSARSLAEAYIKDASGELQRSAWLVSHLARDADGIDLTDFTSLESSVYLASIWPVEVAAKPGAGALERAIAELTPTDLYSRGTPSDGTPADEWASEGKLTRETIVLALLSGGASEPGLVRDQLLEWVPGTDMSHACIWSLCRAAKDDYDLALALRNQLLTLDLNSAEGRLLAKLLAGMAGQGDLVFGLLESALNPSDPKATDRVSMAEYGALFALGELLKSEDAKLSDRAAQFLINLALEPGRSDTLRSVTLGQFAAIAPERLPDALLLVLASPDTDDVKKMAAILTKFMPAAQHDQMRNVLMDTFSSDLSSNVQQNYVNALMSLGGPQSTNFLANLANFAEIDAALKQQILDFLEG